ncbi:hypothetical protein RFI_26666 [Reticulomyxa filosa]|uniref:Uncharacterized protein n=1 Tax=Reticulomyxa filosa TaxID=46433 RepID=X6MB59_RETFI|nr:hypothetical protein RFI_26666 [Reticulomyxa filosa]|eukprot:ETO10712.1 hypothetical protein RFI_26666 [Reticulomyxa filosa]
MIKHTLVMEYVSVWNNISNKSNELNNYNPWVNFTDNRNHPIAIGDVTYLLKNISLFNLNTVQLLNTINYQLIIGYNIIALYQSQKMDKNKE